MSDGNGFMGFWADIDPDHALRYQEWHNCEHMPERVGIRGFLEGRRYRGEGATPTFFMCYFTRNTAVLGGADYLAALNAPTPWTREMLPHFKRPIRNIYRRVRDFDLASGLAPYVLLRRFDDPREATDLASTLGEKVATAARPGLHRATLLEIDDATSNIMTAERSIYAGGPGAQRFMIMLELADRASADELAADLEHDVFGPETADAEGGLYWLENRVRAADLAGAQAREAA